MKPQTIVFTPLNQRVYTFLKKPEFELEPQAQTVLKCIEEFGTCTRFALLEKLATVLETNRTVGQVLSFHQKTLIRCGCIKVEEFEEFTSRSKQEQEEITIVPNSRGGVSIKIGNTEPIGNYATIADAERALENSCL